MSGGIARRFEFVTSGLLIPVLLSLLLSACGDTSIEFSDNSFPKGSGLAARPDNTQCLATHFRQPAAIRLQRLLPRDFERPVGIFPLPGDNDVFYVPQQNGLIWRLVREDDGFSASEFVDLRDFYNIFSSPADCFECGLYSLAFHPDFTGNGYIYLSFTEDGDGSPLQSHIARFRSDDGGLTLAVDDLDPETLARESIYHLRQPDTIHNNGHIAFGPDGYLYAGFGDGGSGDDPDNRAQDINDAFGSILRLTDTGDPAPGNMVPGGLPEIYAYGLRNPWRWSFDRETGQLWAGDVGQAENEEIDIIINGGNYGWRCFEGLGAFTDCGSSGPFNEPVLEYGRSDGNSVTGGYVYRGSEITDLQGVYIFGDFSSGLIWGLFPQDGGYQRIQLLASGKLISSFGEDNNGELYLVDYADGGIYRLKADENDAALPPLPSQLSATGCVNPADPTQPAGGLIPYAINEPFWSDNADKERFMALPNAGQITVRDNGDFVFPVGTVLVKNFRLHGNLVETRLLLNQPDTGWSGYSYQWNGAQTEATLLNGSLETPIGGQLWHYPSRAECSQCHTAAAGYSLGLEARQLNRNFTYPDTGLTVNQLDTFEAIGLFDSALSPEVRALMLPGSMDAANSPATRARSYLHANCSHCHQPEATSQSTMDLRYSTPSTFMNLCDAPPLQSDLDIPDARLLAPGDSSRSIIWHRLESQTEYRMPPIGSTVIDSAGAALIYDWIQSMSGCDTPVGSIDAAYNIRNRANSGFIHARNGTPEAGAIQAEWLSARWTVEPAESPYFRIRSIANPDHYLHVQSLPLKSGVIEEVWWSAQWELVQDGDYFRIRNRWRATHYLNTETGSLRSSAVSPDLPSTQWSFEQVE